MGFLDKLLGRKKADAPQSAPEPAAMPAPDAGGAAPAEHSHDDGEHDHSEGEHGHAH